MTPVGFALYGLAVALVLLALAAPLMGWAPDDDRIFDQPTSADGNEPRAEKGN